MIERHTLTFRRFWLKALLYNLLIAFFVAGLLMLRADTLSWREFLFTLVPSLIYTCTCGLTTSTGLYLVEGWCGDGRLHFRIALLLGIGVVCGALGQFLGSAVLILLELKGPPGIAPASLPFWQRLAATWVYVPLFSLITTSFCLLVFGFEVLKRRLEETASELKEKELQGERLLKLKAEAELRALQARINPHFLFNTLNSIASLISEDPRTAEEMTEKLSALLRYTLNANRCNCVRLEQELYILRSYLDIEQLRFGTRLRVSFDIDDKLQDLSLPPMILQPIVENSVRYAVAPREQGGEILIRGREEDRRCVLEVIDDGPGFDGRTKGSGYALENIRQRLAASYGGRHRFEITRLNGRTVVQLEIPCQAAG
jgi:signal transduction histidine kinase